MYNDDTHLTFAAKTVSNIDSNLNEDLSGVNNWLTAIGLIHLKLSL